MRIIALALAGLAALGTGPAWAADGNTPALTIVIVRHGEKPDDGDNLSCKGLNRALALPPVLLKKFGRPDLAYVPALKQGGSTSHARMFQTVTPMAVQQNLTVNSQFAEDDVGGAAQDLLQRKGLVLVVWEHTQIPPLAQALGVASPPPWGKHDFDSIWVVTPSGGGSATLAVKSEGLKPSDKCKP